MMLNAVLFRIDETLPKVPQGSADLLRKQLVSLAPSEQRDCNSAADGLAADLAGPGVCAAGQPTPGVRLA